MQQPHSLWFHVARTVEEVQPTPDLQYTQEPALKAKVSSALQVEVMWLQECCSALEFSQFSVKKHFPGSHYFQHHCLPHTLDPGPKDINTWNRGPSSSPKNAFLLSYTCWIMNLLLLNTVHSQSNRCENSSPSHHTKYDSKVCKQTRNKDTEQKKEHPAFS